VLSETPLAAVGVSVVVAVVLGLTVDLVAQRVAARRTPQPPAPADDPA
jgi:hypothetical protein